MTIMPNLDNLDAASKEEAFYKMLTDCLGCKWTAMLMVHISNGTNRPGQLVRKIDSLTTKVLNQNLARLVEYKLLEKFTYGEIPPRVEYQLISFGSDLLEILLQLKNLQKKYD